MRILAKHRTPDGGFKSYDALSQDDRLAPQKPVTMLAESPSTAARHAGPSTEGMEQ